MAKIVEHNPFQDLLSKQGIAPLEAMAWTKQNAQSIRISLPKESDPNENRISLSPQAVALLTNNGHEIVIEKGAGERAGFSDSDYLLAGASVSEDVAMIWQSALTLKITPPTIAEIARMKEGQAFISSASYQHLSSELIDAINAKKLMAIGLEFVEDNGGGFPFIKIMAEIAGQLILPIATELIQKKKGLLLGHVTGVPPCNLVLLGSGQVVEQVARAAASAGIQFQVFDKDIYKLQRLKAALGFPIVTQVIDSENLAKALQEAHIIVGALRSDSGITPCIVTEEMVSQLKPGTLILDVCIDQGGCFETSEARTIQNPTFEKYGVTHFCVPNIPSLVAHTASLAMSNLMTSFILKAGKTGGVEEMLWQGKSFMKGVFCYKGFVTQPSTGKLFHKPVKDIQLLLLSKS
jgi:alanine dehydrogenase